jgi:hypothetical protein
VSPPVVEEVEPSELWLALTALPRPHRVVPFPRNLPGSDSPVGELAVWPLTQEEQMAANVEADRWTKKLLKDPQQKDQANLGYHHTYSNEVAIQVLWRACRDPKNIERPAFPSPALMRAKLSTDEVGVLFSQYLTVQSEIGPIVAYMSKDERDAWILRLQEGGSAFPFDSLSWEQQRILVTSMASQLVSCWTAMCSLGSPPDVSDFILDTLQERLQRAPTALDESPDAPVDSPPTSE